MGDSDVDVFMVKTLSRQVGPCLINLLDLMRQLYCHTGYLLITYYQFLVKIHRSLNGIPCIIVDYELTCAALS